MTDARETLSTQVDAALLKALRSLADEEGRQIQGLVHEALADLLDKRAHGAVRPEVWAAYQASHAEFAPLYKKLAK